MKMPHVKRPPIQDRERQVCNRLRQAREILRLTQSEFASEVGITRARLASYEEGRAAVRFDLGLRICRQFLISEKWLATGAGDPRLMMDLETGIPWSRVLADIGFGLAYDKHLSSYYESIFSQQNGQMRIVPRSGDGVEFWRNVFNLLLNRWYDALPPEESVDLIFALATAGIVLVEKRSLSASRKRFGVSESDLEVTIHVFNASPEEEGEKTLLTEVTAIGNIAPVKSQMVKLLGRLNKSTAKRGMKSKLAKFMGVPLANVSQWLSGVREPGGENTLRLLRWVEQQER